MHHPLPLLVALLVAGTALGGCMGPAGDDAVVTTHTWLVGDLWTYVRTLDGGAPFVYTREVTSLFPKGPYEVFEMTEGLAGHSIRQRSLYTIDDLRFFGFEVYEGETIRHTMAPEDPLPFHYVFPLEPGAERTVKGSLRQTSGELVQVEPVEVTTRVDTPRSLTLGERIYQVYPYEIRIRFPATPFDDGATIRGHWASAVGQSVLTEVDQGGSLTRYELVSFQRREPAPGGPAYGLVGALRSTVLDRGFKAAVDAPGYARWLFHVEAPTTVGVRFDRPVDIDESTRHRFDLVALRPVGTTGAWIMRDAAALEGRDLAFHMWAAAPGGSGYEFHSDTGPADGGVRLMPGLVYELVVASNHDGAYAVLTVGEEERARAPAQTGRVDILKIAHRHVAETTLPGPQSVRDRESVLIALPEGERIEGVVFAVNHGGDAIGETGGTRRVGFGVDDLFVEDEASVFGVYLSHPTHEPFEVSVSYEYRADLALQGAVDYELGMFLMRLVPEDP